MAFVPFWNVDYAFLESAVPAKAKLNYELISLSAYVLDLEVRFCALWAERKEKIRPSRIAKYNSQHELALGVEAQRAQSYYISHLAVAVVQGFQYTSASSGTYEYGPDDKPSKTFDGDPHVSAHTALVSYSEYVAVFEFQPHLFDPKSPGGVAAGMDRPPLFVCDWPITDVWWFSGLQGYGMMPRSFGLYERAGVVQFSVIFWPHSKDIPRRPDWPIDPDMVPWALRLSETETEHATMVKIMCDWNSPNPLRYAAASVLRRGDVVVQDNVPNSKPNITILSYLRDDPYLNWAFKNPAWEMVLDIRLDEVDNHFTQYQSQGFNVVSAIATGAGENTRFSLHFAQTDVPLARHFHVASASAGFSAMPSSPPQPPSGQPPITAQGGLTGIGQEVLASAETQLDDYIHWLMRQSGVRAAQVAITRNSRLLASRVYTLAEDGCRKPTHQTRFRLGSVSKALTKLAILAHVAGTPGKSLDDSISATLSGRYGKPDFDPLFDATTLKELITHRSGIIQDLEDSHVKATQEAADAAKIANSGELIQFPCLPKWLMDYAYRHTVAKSGNKYEQDSIPIIAGPVGSYHYNGFSVFLLARYLEVSTKRFEGDWFEEIKNLLSLGPEKLNIYRARLLDDNYGDSGSYNEAIFHGLNPGFTFNFRGDSKDAGTPGKDPFGPVPYIRNEYAWLLNMAGPPGGFCMAAIDMARILAALTSAFPGGAAKNPALAEILSPSAAGAMFENTTVGGVATGINAAGMFFYEWREGSEEPTPANIVGHNGGNSGTRAEAMMRVDGTSITFAFNGDFTEFALEAYPKSPGLSYWQILFKLADALNDSPDLFPIVDPEHWGGG